MMASFGVWLLVSLALCMPACCSLYGYYTDGTTSGLVVVDPQSGDSKVVCDLSSLPELSGASSSSRYTVGGDTPNTLFFYTIDATGNISLVTLDPSTCKTNSTRVTGLNSGQNLVRDIKYDSANGMLYMVFPNPFCMHGSLDKINTATGAVISNLANVIDPEGLSQTAGLSGTSGVYYYVGIPLASTDCIYLNKILLTTGNITSINLANNNLDVGDSWGSNYTLNVITTDEGDSVFGAVSPSTTAVAECSPSGFYSINPVTGNVTCVFGPIQYMVYPLAELDSSTQYYYQLFNDESNNFFIVTFDIIKKKVVYSAPCDICGKLSVLAALP